jgi:hypothetical protein
VEQYCRLEWALEECGRRGTEGKRRKERRASYHGLKCGH